MNNRSKTSIRVWRNLIAKLFLAFFFFRYSLNAQQSDKDGRPIEFTLRGAVDYKEENVKVVETVSGRSWIILVGIWDYDSLSKLPGVQEDIRKVYEYFDTPIYEVLTSESKILFHPIRDLTTLKLPDDVPMSHRTISLITSDDLQEAATLLEELAIKEGDRVFLYYSGHGATLNEKTVILPKDAAKGYVEHYAVHFWDDVINSLMLRSPSSITVFLDMCRTNISRREIKGPEDLDGRMSVNFEAAEASGAVNVDLDVYYACAKSESVKFDKKASDKSSRFTELILKGLRGQADSSDDGLITHRELRQYLLEESKNYAEEINRSFYSNWSESSPTIDRVIAIGSSPISFSKYAKTKLRKLESIEPAFDSDLLEILYSNLTRVTSYPSCKKKNGVTS